jgi:hypothetical protein
LNVNVSYESEEVPGLEESEVKVTGEGCEVSSGGESGVYALFEGRRSHREAW